MPKEAPYPDSQAKGMPQVIFRKTIHLSGFSVPFIAISFSIIPAVAFILVLTVLYCISEYARLNGRKMPVIAAITNQAIRAGRGETKGAFITAPLYLAAGILISLMLFPEPINYVAVTVVTLGDGVAPIAGRIFGRTKVPRCHGKTLEGTIAGLACPFAGSLIFASPLIAFATAAVGMLVELLPLKVNDNLAIPLVTGSVMTLAMMSS